ncbi:hypothetical protein Trydic_g15147 [Trypoxylus dichotomus]
MFSERLIVTVLVVLACTTENSRSLDCSSAPRICEKFDSNCEECVRSHPCCSWCLNESYTSIRCNTKQNLLNMRCAEDSIYSASNSHVDVAGLNNESFKNPIEEKNQPAVQIRPQKMNIQLRLNDPVTFQLQYKAAMDYPLDLYYLMDLTYSMRGDVGVMVKLGSEMAERLTKLTKSYKIAFGYFMDKVVMPFSANNKKYLEDPCKISGNSCETGYDFIHALNFTTKISEFVQKLNSSKITANMDDLEGALDAIMQIIVCKNQMQWRTFSRKIIVVATDGLLHFAGDGILAGIVEKNPGICLVDSDGMYLGALDYDYPSLEEIYRKLLQYKVNLLFAAKSTVFPYYDDLEKTMPTVSYVGELEKESQNILKLIEASYMKVISSARFDAKAPDEIKVTFRSTCNEGEMLERNFCHNIEIGKVYSFDVTLELVELPKEKRGRVIIEEMNLAENVDINIEYVGIDCKCPNQSAEHTQCANGIFRCGKCICNKDWAGHLCDKECFKFPCRFVNETYTSSTCYSHGDCDIARCQCVCYPEYMGDFCEYNQCKRNRKTQRICSDHGTCDKGVCFCDPLYEGDDCSCYTGTEKCAVPGKELCSGVGNCTCGECQCPKEYAGERCEYCPSCDKMCEAYDDCIISTAQNKTTHACSTNETFYITQRANKIEAKCLARYFNEQNTRCEIGYTYFVEGNTIRLVYLDPYCPPPFYASMTAISAFAAIIVVGVTVLIIWKFTTLYRDRIAYQKFVAECEKNKLSEELNPLYRSPVRQYFNPNRADGEMSETVFG